MPKFYNHTGLNAYAFACGYVQRVEVKDADVDIRIDLWHEGACYHVRAHDHKAGTRLEWVSEDNLTDARAQWKRMVTTLAGRQILEIRKDGRYTVAREYCGDAEPVWVARWLDEEITCAVDGHSVSFGCSSPEQAWARCYSHNWSRMDHAIRQVEKLYERP